MFEEILGREKTQAFIGYYGRKISKCFPVLYTYEDGKQELTLGLLSEFDRGAFKGLSELHIQNKVLSVIKWKFIDLIRSSRKAGIQKYLNENTETIDEFRTSCDYDRKVYQYTDDYGVTRYLRRSQLDTAYVEVAGRFLNSELASLKNAGKILTMIAEGYQHSEIADELGVTAMYVRKLRNDHVVPALQMEL
jgi:hypothetical protein